MLQAVLFDLDGTLAHTDPIHFEVFKVMLAEQGISLDDVMYRQRISGRTNQAILNDLLPRFSPAEVMAFSETKEQRFREAARAQLQPMAGLMPLLDWLEQQGLATAVVTNAPRLNAEFMLEGLGLRDRFDCLILGEDLPRAKPDPLPYQTALNQLGIAPEAAVVFEDSPSGIRAGVAAQVPTVGVTSSHAAQTLLDLGAQIAIADFTDLRLQNLGFWLT